MKLQQYLSEANYNETNVRELVLFINNDGDLYRQRISPIIKNLKKKVAKGVYDPKLALKLWKPLADEGAKKYAKEHGSAGDNGLKMFSVADRKQVALELADNYDEKVQEY